MPQTPDWQRDLRDALRHEGWSLGGPTRLVKVVPLGAPLTRAVHGYVCVEKSLLGKTPLAIEATLGVKVGSLGAGCRVYRLLRLPNPSEVDYELTAKHPNGLAFNPALHDPSYPPGSASVHQWRLLADVPAELLLELAADESYPYLHH